eukprot:TRINITY_DN549_c0_g1_i17.p1 TRINITY_DN549_c0_g1~~TRINITY_DN549_c0_g1_i17.p1  ORF type:complete len:180 (-),score=16.76 TRINITY_DN549_c0_g1_i17:221-760(-)
MHYRSNKSKAKESLPDNDSKMEGTSVKQVYSQVDFTLRKELLHVIGKEQLSIKSAASKLGINYSTAKNIVRVYRKENRVNKLPKRVSRALANVLNKQKQPPKKVTRFSAKTFSLVEKEAIPSVENTKFEDAKSKEEKLVPMEDKEERKGPTFDFSVYRSLIAEHWIKNKSECRIRIKYI